MDSTEEARSSGSAPDATPEARRKEMLDQILVMVTKMASDLKECNAALRAARTAFVADSDDCGRRVDFTAGTGSSSEYLLATSDSQIDAKLPATVLIPSPTSAPLQDADPGFPSGVTELAVSTDGNLGVVFDADNGGVDRLSHLPDLLLREIIARLPIKDAARTTVLSHRWSPIWRAAPLVALDDFHFSHDLKPPKFKHLSLCSVDFLPSRDPACKVAVNLFVAHCGARVIYDGDACYVVLGRNPTTSNMGMTASSSPTTSPTSAPILDVALDFNFDITKLLIASPTRCSTLGFYQVFITLMPATTSSASPLSTSTAMPLASATINTYILATLPTNTDHTQGNRMPKPPWLLGIMVSRSWSGSMQLICGFLLEISPWCNVGVNYLLAYSAVQFWMHCHGLECLHGCPALGMISPLSLLRPPDSSNPSCKPYIDNSCIITFDPGITYLSICTVRFTISDDQAMSALLLRKEQFRAIIPFQKSREEFLATVEFAMLTSKCSPHYVRYLSEIKTATILSIVLFESEEDERKPHRLHFLDNAAQDDGGNIRGVAALLLYNLSQMWLFTAILAAGKCLLLSGEIYLITYSWSKYQLVSSRAFQLEGDSARLDLQEDNLPHGHCYLLKNVVVYMVIASQMAFESIKSGGLIAQDGSKGRMICDYSIQFMLETVFFKGGMALDGDFDLHKLFHGSLLQAVLTLQFFVVCHGDGVVQWDRKILLLTWEILKVQKKCGSFASAPSWTRLKQDQIKVSGNAAKQLKLYTIPNYAFLSDSTCTTVALKESIYKIALSINDSEVNIQNKWCRLLCSSPRVEEMVFQLFVLNGTLCSMPQLLSASQCSVPWDPGIYEALWIFHITIHGLGASRVLRRGECHDTATDTWAGPMKGYLGWAITKGRQCLNVSLGQVGRDDTIKHSTPAPERLSKDQNLNTAATSASASRGERLLEASFGPVNSLVAGVQDTRTVTAPGYSFEGSIQPPCQGPFSFSLHYSQDCINSAESPVGFYGNNMLDVSAMIDTSSVASRRSVRLIHEVISTFGNEKDLVRSIGFHGLLFFPSLKQINLRFSALLMSRVDEATQSLHIDGQTHIHFNKEDVSRVFGIPSAGRSIFSKTAKHFTENPTSDSEAVHLNIKQLRSIKAAQAILVRDHAGQMSLTEQDEFKAAFVLFVMSTLLAPCAKHDRVCDDFMHVLSNPSQIISYDWSEYVLRRLLDAVSKLKADLASNVKVPYIYGCSLFLQVLYLDSVNMGTLSMEHNSFPHVRCFTYDRLRAMIAADSSSSSPCSISSNHSHSPKLRPPNGICYHWVTSKSTNNNNTNQNGMLALWEVCVLMTRILNVPLEAAGPLFVAVSDFQRQISSAEFQKQFSTSLGSEGMKFLSLLLRIMEPCVNGFRYRSQSNTESPPSGLCSMWQSQRCNNPHSETHNSSILPKRKCIIFSGETSSSSTTDGTLKKRLHIVNSSSPEIVYASASPRRELADTRLQGIGPFVQDALNTQDNNISATKAMARFFLSFRHAKDIKCTDLNKTPTVDDNGYSVRLPEGCYPSLNPRSPWELGFMHRIDLAKASSLYKNLTMVEETDEPWIVHFCPKYIEVRTSAVKAQFLGKTEMEMELVDAVIRRFKQLDDDLYMFQGLARWRHYVESDFMVSLLAGRFDISDPVVRAHFHGRHIRYDVTACKFLFFPVILQYRWACLAWWMHDNTIVVYDPCPPSKSHSFLLSHYERVVKLLKSAMVLVSQNTFNGWRKGWEEARFELFNHPEIPLNRPNRSGVLCLYFCRCFDGEQNRYARICARLESKT